MINKSLQKFQTNNPGINIIEETEHINITNLWGDDTFMCRFKKNEKFSSLENILLPPELAAIYNTKTKSIEFIFSPLELTDPIILRKFNFYYKGVEFKAEFTHPSEAFKLVTTAFREVRISSLTNYRNIYRFRDFYKKESSQPWIKHYYEDKTPIVFKVTGDFDKINLEFVSFSKNLNFYLDYYDRSSPYILIYENEEEESYNLPCYSTKQTLPEVINVRTLDPVLVDLFEVARTTTNTRLRFLFYFQVLEFCSYYHLTDKFNKKLTKILKNPDLMVNSNYYGKLLTEEFKDQFSQKDDEAKILRLVTEFVEFDDIKLEIEGNIDYFKKDVCFDGGLTIKSLLGQNDDLSNVSQSIIPTIKTNIEKIRNTLVHIRESRENKIILPTTKNTNLLLPYLHVLKRIAEKVSIQYE